ncbi:hypothetical protein [Vibrio ziniensis]|uniref:Uncharacterized protein n=1 Tax=Vibrio ziniensis TaxID=2711221 RepID=A0A6G7CFW0_9VIBR|nr:hypothetical protein [Vibrio ziniensis]QIH41005.1 hypothetical protein G5S32_02950 [Vibrio ziniensis]
MANDALLSALSHIVSKEQELNDLEQHFQSPKPNHKTVNDQEKLKKRAIRIVMQATDCNSQTAESLLIECGYSAKVAILMLLTGVDADFAKEKLSESDGVLHKVIKEQ